MKNLALISVFFCICSNTYSIDTNSIKYFPLQVGNVYVYFWQYNALPPSSGKLRKYVDKDTVINSHRYFRFGDSENMYWYRSDSNTGSFYNYRLGTVGCNQPTPYDYLEDSLALPWRANYICGSATFECYDTNFINVFGITRSVKTLGYSSIAIGNGTRYSKDIGPIYHYSSSHNYSYSETILGCVINGILYGDTSYYPNSVNQLITETPIGFGLSQNYPNPFNPSTNIEYQIKKNGHITLIIYDALGREIISLVNQKQSMGTYAVNWDASNYPSGVYLYSLNIDGIVMDTKKMILIK